MTRVEQNIQECWNTETEEFDWEEYSYLCSLADYRDAEE